MTDLTNTNSSQSHSQARQGFSYRKSTKQLYLWAIAALLLSCAIIVRVRMTEVLEEETILAVGKLVLACSVPLSILIRLVFIVQPRLFSRYELTDDELIRVSGRKRHHFHFENIVSIKISFFSPRFAGGFKIFMKSGQKLVFLSALKNSHLILEKIISARPELLPKQKFNDYMGQSRRVDVSWQRLKEKLLRFKMLISKYIFAPLALAAIAHFSGYDFYVEATVFEQLASLFLTGFVFAFILGAIGNSIEEKWSLSYCQWNSETHQFDRQLSKEKKIAHLFDGLFFVVMLGVGVALMWPTH